MYTLTLLALISKLTWALPVHVAAHLRREEPASTGSATSTSGDLGNLALDTALESMATQVKSVLPQVPITVIRKDISTLLVCLCTLIYPDFANLHYHFIQILLVS